MLWIKNNEKKRTSIDVLKMKQINYVKTFFEPGEILKQDHLKAIICWQQTRRIHSTVELFSLIAPITAVADRKYYLNSLRNNLPTLDLGISSIKITCLGTL